jgi:glycogen(starch) synthase
MWRWEFPPFMSGGIDTASYGLTKSISKPEVQTTFVLPTSVESSRKHLKMLGIEEYIGKTEK